MEAPSVPPVSTVEEIETDYGPAGSDGYPVQVRVMGPVYTQELPAGNSADGNFNATTTDAQSAFDANPRRKSVMFWCETNGIYFGKDRGSVIGGRSAHLPPGGSVTITHKDAVYMRGDTGTALVSYVQELYGD